MTSRALLPTVRKEARALLPMWAGCMLAVFAVYKLHNPMLLPFAVVIYGLVSIGMGAQSMGHEYGHRTISLMLSHPVDRRLLLIIKLAVLAPLLAVLGLFVFATVVPELYNVGLHAIIAPSAGVLIFLAALTLAPALTMVCRSGIAGMVFTIGIAGAVGIVSEFVFYGPDVAILFWYTMLTACALGALIGWRQYGRLEANDGRGRDLHLPGFGARASAVDVSAQPVRDPIMRLIAKELRLQQMALALAAMCLATIFIMVACHAYDPRTSLTLLVPITLMYAGALPLVIGALASAEERQMGTLQWQQLMPMPARAQFAVKAAVALSLALVLALGLPALAMWLVGTDLDFRAGPFLTAAVIVATSASLYVSSLNSSGVRAILIALPTLLVIWVGLIYLQRGLWILLNLLLIRFPGWHPFGMWGALHPAVELALITLFVGALAWLLLFFAHENHRSAERPSTQLKQQAPSIIGAVVAGMLLLILIGVR